MNVTLGGDRLGTGKKMKVQTKEYERSNHDMSRMWRSSMAPGTLVPCFKEIGLPGDSFDINIGMEVLTLPTNGPLFDSFKVQVDGFVAPIRLYNALLHNNTLGIGLDMSQVKLPVIEMQAQSVPDVSTITDIDNCQTNPSSLLAYLGYRGAGLNGTDDPVNRKFQAVPLIMYYDIYKNYYANRQEGIGAVLHTQSATVIETVDSVEISGMTIATYPDRQSQPIGDAYQEWKINFTGATPNPKSIMILTEEFGWIPLDDLATGFTNPSTGLLFSTYNSTRWGQINAQAWRYRNNTDINNGKPSIKTFSLEQIDEQREDLLAHNSRTLPYVISNHLGGNFEPYAWLCEVTNGTPNSLSSQEGLALKTYQSDKFQNWLETEAFDGTGGINEITSVDTTGNKFEINALILANKVFEMLNDIAVSDGSLRGWINAAYDHEYMMHIVSPYYIGSLIKELQFQQVISNSASADQPLGTLGGRGTLGQKHKGGNISIKIDEPSYIMFLVSITPRIVYSQGNDWDTYSLLTYDDLHKPGLDQIGFEESINEQRAWWDTTATPDGLSWTQHSAGKIPAWLDYMTAINKSLGDFAIPTNSMFMTLNRRYEQGENIVTGGNIKDLTTYIDPSKFNYAFAETQLDAQNFWVHIGFDVNARRKMSKKVMPRL